MHYIQPIITNLQRGSAQPHVYAKDVNRIRILIPPKDMLEKINSTLKELYEREALIKQQLEENKTQIELILKRFLTNDK